MKTEFPAHDSYLDNALLVDFARNFAGYGDPASKLWFVGIEEGGGGCILDVKARMETWRRLGRQRFVDAKRFHHSLAKALDGAQCDSTSVSKLFPKAAEKVELQATWKLLVETALRAREELPADPQARSNRLREFQLNNLGEIAMLELFPLPNPGTNAIAWNERYPRWVREAQGITRSQYERNCAPVREAAIRSLILNHKPHAVIFYGRSRQQHWKRIVGDGLHEDNHGFLGTLGSTPLYSLPHPAAYQCRPHQAFENAATDILSRFQRC